MSICLEHLAINDEIGEAFPLAQEYSSQVSLCTCKSYKTTYKCLTTAKEITYGSEVEPPSSRNDGG